MPTQRDKLNEMEQHTSVIQELEIAISCIETGLYILQQSRLYQTRYFPFLFLLSIGFERLLKVILTLQNYEAHKTFLDDKQLRNYGHGLKKLCSGVVEHCFTSDYLKRTFAQADKDFLTTDTLLGEILDLMSEFAEKLRYVYLDKTAKASTVIESPELRWSNIETGQMTQDELLALSDLERADWAKERGTTRVIICLEKFMRALSRLFVFGELGAEGRRQAAIVRRYAKLDDHELGTTTYQL